MRAKHTIIQTILEIATMIGLMIIWIYILKSWYSLPDRIPSHYNSAGVADQWGNKSGILFLPIIGTILYVFITIISFFPSIWNVPVMVTEANREFVYRNMMTMMILMKLEMILCFVYITYCNIHLKSLGIWFLPLFLIVLFGTIAYYTIKVLRYCR